MHDDRFIRHRRHIGPAGRTRAHYHCDLRNARRRHGGLIVKDAAKMLPVRENVVLHGQKRPAGVDQVDAWQTVFFGDFLRPQMFFDREREIGTPFDGGVIGDNHHLRAVHDPNTGYDAG